MNRLVGWKRVSLAVLMTAAISTLAHAQQPTVVLSIRGIEPLLSDAEFIGGEIGQEGARDTAEQLIGVFTGGKGLAGIDQTKPLGVYWNATAAGAPEMPVAYLPVADEDDLKGLLTDLAPDFKDANGQWSATVNGSKLFGKVSNGYLFISPIPTALTKLSDPSKISNAKYDIALDVSIASIPEQLKSIFLSTLETSGRQALESGPEPENEAGKVARDVTINAAVAAINALVTDGDRLTLGVDVDAKSRLAALDLGITGKANTDLAKAMTAYGKTQPMFASIGSDSAPLRMVVSYPTTGIADQLSEVIEASRATINEQIEADERLDDDKDREAAKGLAGRLLDITKATVKTGSMHSGIVLEAGGEGKVRVIGGAKVADGTEAGKLLDDVIKLSKENPDLAKVKVDVAKQGTARIHAVTADQDEDTLKYFGDEPGHLAFRSDSLWGAIGGDNLVALKKALDAKPAARTTLSPISFQVKPGALFLLMEKDDQDLLERAKEVAGKPGDKLSVDIAPVSNGAKLRVEFGIDLLQLAEFEDEEESDK